MPLLPAAALLALLLAPAEDSLGRARTRIERLAKELAEDGIAADARGCIRAYGELGGDAGRLDKLEQAVEKALGKARGEASVRDLEKHAKAAGEVAGWLVHAAREAPARRDELLAAALDFDHRGESVRKELGHVLGADGVYRSPRLDACVARRAEMARALQRARTLEIDVRAVEPDDPTLLAICGDRKPSAAAHEGLVIQSVWPQERLETVYRDVLRAMAWSNWLVHGEMVPFHARDTYVHLLYRPEYEDYIAAARDAGLLTDEVFDRAQEMSGVRLERKLRTGYATVTHQVGTESQGYLGTTLLTLYDFALYPLPGRGSAEPPDWVRAGHANFVGLSFLGTRMQRWASVEEVEIERTSTVRTRIELRLPNAGIVGCRSYLRALALEGSAPQLASCLLPLPDVTGPLLLRATSTVEMLHEDDAMETFLAGHGRAAAKGGHPAALTEAGLGFALPELEQRWTEWIVGDDAGRSLAGRLLSRARSAGAGLPPEVGRVVLQLNELRKSMRLEPVEVVDELSRGARLHAAYLSAHPEQAAAWPDAHEEWPDVPEFTPEGAWAGGASVIAFNGAERCIDEWIGTFYHRVPLTHPGLVAIGFAEVDGICVLDCGSLVDPNAGGFVTYPFDGQKDVPTWFVPELPNPVPEVEDQGFGYPVTLQLGPDWGDVQVELRLLRGGGEVDAWVSTPAEPTNPKLSPERTWCLMPKEPLAPRTAYTVEAKLPDREVTWSFTTGR